MNRQRLDHLVQIGSSRFLCLSKDFDLLLKGTYLLVLLLTVSTVVRFININDFDCNNHSGFHVTAAGEPKVSFKRMAQPERSYHLYTRPKEPLPISSSKAYSGIEAPLLLHFSITLVSCAFAKRMASLRCWLTASADSGRRRSIASESDSLSESDGRRRCWIRLRVMRGVSSSTTIAASDSAVVGAKLWLTEVTFPGRGGEEPNVRAVGPRFSKAATRDLTETLGGGSDAR